MQRILNDPDNIVDEMLSGFLKANSDIVEATENKRIVKARCKGEGKVGVITGAAPGINRHSLVMSEKICAMLRQLVKSVLPLQQLPFLMRPNVQIREKEWHVSMEIIPGIT